jgi:hypothetical protein
MCQAGEFAIRAPIFTVYAEIYTAKKRYVIVVYAERQRKNLEGTMRKYVSSG